MSLPTLEEARRLAEWRPPLGVVSVYLRVDPGDRGGGWRTELRNGLSALMERSHELGHEAASALRATCARIDDHFANHERSLPRAEIGFVEVAAKNGGGRWWSAHVAPPALPATALDERPRVAPLVSLLERGAGRGVVLVSGERVRLLEWEPGRLEELHAWELSILSRDWRERKAQRVPDPARAQAVSASGHDQFDERLAENRRRFLGECGRLAAEEARGRDWHEALVFGAADHFREFEHAAAARGLNVVQGGEADLISEPSGRLEPTVGEAAAWVEGIRDRELVERALDAARGGRRGAVGEQETAAVLAEARVEELLIDASRAASSEPLVRAALEGGGRVRAVSGAAAELLGDVDGIAAMLRY